MGLLDNLFGAKQTTSAAPVQTGKPASKILIVEDEKMLADALELKLKNEGFEVLKAQNGQIGLEMAIASKPNVILLDIMMPVMDGKHMLQKLREIPEFKNLPVIVLTNAGEADNIRETKFYFNAIDFLIKSNVSIDEIVNKVKSNIY